MARRTALHRLPALLAASCAATACTEVVTPERPAATPPAEFSYASTTDTIWISGQGTIGPGPAQPGSDLRDFDLEVASTVGGRVFFRDWTAVRPDGSVGTLTVSPADTATRITDFQNGSTGCPDPARGVEVSGIGRVNSGGDSDPAGNELLAFTAVACDGTWGTTVDWLGMAVPAHGYARGPDPLSSGDLVKTAAGAPPVNQSPAVNAGSDSTVAVGLLYTLRVTFPDPDNGPWRYRIDWNDGSWDTGTSLSANDPITATHSYLMPGSYTIRVTVLDALGGAGSDEIVLTVLL